tara:strand:- start:9554 stop:11368 length:1815 start_codon:yes stop_codon:yes gene_type:complete
MATNQIATLGVKVDPRGAITGAKRAKKAIQGIGKVASRVKKSIFSLQGAFIGLGAGLAIKSAIAYGSEIESLQIRLRFLTGSTEKATKAFDQMLAVSKTAPVSLKEIQRASPLLLTVADDIEELTSLLEMTGDIAEVSGLSFEKTAEQIQRAFSAGIGSAEMFREKAVTSMMGFEAGVQKTGAETKRIFVDMFKNGTTVMKGAMQEGAKTMKGQISMMKDGWDGLLLAFSDAGAFDAVKRAMKEIEKTLKSEEGLKMAEDFGRAVGQFIDGTVGMKDALFDMIATLDTSLMFFGRMPKTLGGMEKAISNVKGEIESLTGTLVDIEGDGLFNWLLNFGKDITLDENARILIKGLNKDLQELVDLREALLKKQGLIADNDNKELGLESIAFVTEYSEAVSTAGQSLAFLSHNANTAKNAVEIMQEQFGEFILITDEAKEKQKEFADGLSSSIEESIMKMTQGLMSFKDVVKSVFQYVAQQVVRNNIANPLANALSGIMTGAIGGFATNTSSGTPLPAGRKAIGGNVQSNKPYIVGEQGAELFSPSGSGTITPNHRMGGGQTINVTYSPQINALDPRTAQSVIAENATTIVAVVRQAFNQNGQEVAI